VGGWAGTKSSTGESRPAPAVSCVAVSS